MKKDKQQELADRQDYLVDRLTNGEEEFYRISIILNSLVIKEKK